MSGFVLISVVEPVSHFHLHCKEAEIFCLWLWTVFMKTVFNTMQLPCNGATFWWGLICILWTVFQMMLNHHHLVPEKTVSLIRIFVLKDVQPLPFCPLFAWCHISLSVCVFVCFSSLLNGFVLFSICVVCPLSTSLPLYIGEEVVWLKSHLLLSNFPLVWQSTFFCHYNCVYYDFLWIHSVHTTYNAFLSVLIGGYLLSQVSSLSCCSSFFLV